MKRILLAVTMALGALGAMTAVTAQAADIGVSINIGQPGFYGRIDLGNAPAPQLYYREPIWVQRESIRPEPIYLRVPPGHQSNWKRYCREYGACGVPVYFVRDDWYRNTYVPHYRDYHDERGWRSERREDRREDRRDDRRDDRKDDRRDNRDHDRGNGNGNGNGHGRGHDKDRGHGHD